MRNTIYSLLILVLAVALVITIIKSLFKLTGAIIVIALIIFAIKYLMDKRDYKDYRD